MERDLVYKKQTFEQSCGKELAPSLNHIVTSNVDKDNHCSNMYDIITTVATTRLLPTRVWMDNSLIK